MSIPPASEDQVMPAMDAVRFSVDGLTPEKAYAPTAPGEISALLQEANAQRWSVVPFGSGSKQHIGNALTKFDLAVSMEKFTRIPEFEPQDLVVKVESGCRLADLQERLAQDNLFLPIDPASGADATLGGIVSCHDSGPLRFSQGTVRDHLIGITVVQPDGAVTKFGSRVVKNVTGYDMCKLYTGAFGTLGILVDFFFKLKPLPPFQKTVVVTLQGLSATRDAIDKLLRSPLVPSALEFLNPAALSFLNKRLSLTNGESQYALVIRFGDVESAVQWQIEQLEKLWGELVGQGTIVGDLSEQALLWQALREDRPWLEDSLPVTVKLKVNCLPSHLAETTQSLESLRKELNAEVWIKAHAGSGVLRVYLELDTSETMAGRFAEQLSHLRLALKPSRGTVVVEHLPPSWKRTIDVWGYTFKDKVLMERIRQQFDPLGILNPGRFVV